MAATSDLIFARSVKICLTIVERSAFPSGMTNETFLTPLYKSTLTGNTLYGYDGRRARHTAQNISREKVDRSVFGCI